MEPSTIVAIINPNAGGGKGAELIPRLRTALETTGRPFLVHPTSSQGDAQASACRYAQEGAGLVVAVGGDGSIHEVANGLCASGTRVPMGIVPAGRGSDFVRTVKTPESMEAAVAHAVGTAPRAIDIGRASYADGTSQCFINVAGLGFDAIVAERVNTKNKLPGSNLPYLVASLQTLVGYRNIQVVVDADGVVFSTYAVFVQIANGQYMGGGYKIAPQADIEDGMLDLALVGDLSKPDLLKTLPKVYGGNHVTHPKFTYLRAKTIRVETIQPARVQLDGELSGGSPVTFSVEPGGLMLAG